MKSHVKYAESNGVDIVAIGPVDPELYQVGWLLDIVTWDFTALLAVPLTVAMVTHAVNLTSSGLVWPASRHKVAACVSAESLRSLAIAFCCRGDDQFKKSSCKLYL